MSSPWKEGTKLPGDYVMIDELYGATRDGKKKEKKKVEKKGRNMEEGSPAAGRLLLSHDSIIETAQIYELTLYNNSHSFPPDGQCPASKD